MGPPPARRFIVRVAVDPLDERIDPRFGRPPVHDGIELGLLLIDLPPFQVQEVSILVQHPMSTKSCTGTICSCPRPSARYFIASTERWTWYFPSGCCRKVAVGVRLSQMVMFFPAPFGPSSPNMPCGNIEEPVLQSLGAVWIPLGQSFDAQLHASLRFGLHRHLRVDQATSSCRKPVARQKIAVRPGGDLARRVFNGQRTRLLLRTLAR